VSLPGSIQPLLLQQAQRLGQRKDAVNRCGVVIGADNWVIDIGEDAGAVYRVMGP